MRSIRLSKPTPLGWSVAGGIAVIAGTITFLLLHNPIPAVVIGVLGAVGFVLTGARSAAEASPEPEPAPVAVPAQRVEALPTPDPVVVAAVAAPAAAATAGVAPPMPLPMPLPMPPPMPLPADPLDQVNLLSAYLHDEPNGYQPAYAAEAPTLVSRVPGQTLTVTEPDPLATAFVTTDAPTEPPTAPNDGTAWRVGVDILPQSRLSAAAVGNRLGSFRSAVLKARREDKPKPPAGKHRAG
jgi:hypothetical protein